MGDPALSCLMVTLICIVGCQYKENKSLYYNQQDEDHVESESASFLPEMLFSLDGYLFKSDSPLKVQEQDDELPPQDEEEHQHVPEEH